MPNIPRTARENKVGCLSLSTWVDNLALTGGTAASYTVPAATNPTEPWRLVRITYSAGSLYASIGQTAVIPSATVSDGTGSALVLQGDTFQVEGGQVISLKNATTCVVDIMVWS